MSETTGFRPLRIAVMTVSDSRTEATDKSGRLLAERLAEAGHELAAQRIVRDEPAEIGAMVADWIADSDIQVVITTGGTGITGRDGTPEAIRPLLGKVIDGFGEIFRMISFQEIGTSALQSRALAGVADGTFIFVLPGSPGACRTAWDRLIRDQLDGRTRPCNLVELLPRLGET